VTLQDQSAINSAGFDALASGNFHVGYAAIGVVLLGLFVLAAAPWLGVVLVVLGTGIFVSMWARGDYR
jgi:hypothetical protein